MDFQFRPIVQWPGEMTKARKRSQFMAGWGDTLKLLDHELSYLKAKNVVIQAAVNERDIRNDGMLRADARTFGHPGVILSFESKHGPLSYPCDRYLHWQDNVRAIAMAMEALRAVDRYGVTRRGEQYKGWNALPAPPRPDDPVLAAERISKLCRGEYSASEILKISEVLKSAYRAAALYVHPDHGGTAAEFEQLVRDVKLLEKTTV